jgi:hypothetical protein
MVPVIWSLTRSLSGLIILIARLALSTSACFSASVLGLGIYTPSAPPGVLGNRSTRGFTTPHQSSCDVSDTGLGSFRRTVCGPPSVSFLSGFFAQTLQRVMTSFLSYRLKSVVSWFFPRLRS